MVEQGQFDDDDDDDDDPYSSHALVVIAERLQSAWNVVQTERAGNGQGRKDVQVCNPILGTGTSRNRDEFR